jgi:hypothetical protein
MSEGSECSFFDVRYAGAQGLAAGIAHQRITGSATAARPSGGSPSLLSPMMGQPSTLYNVTVRKVFDWIVGAAQDDAQTLYGSVSPANQSTAFPQDDLAAE